MPLPYCPPGESTRCPHPPAPRTRPGLSAPSLTWVTTAGRLHAVLCHVWERSYAGALCSKLTSRGVDRPLTALALQET